MTEADWLTGEHPVAMLRLITENPDHCNINCVRSDRKLRLFAVACCRLAWDELSDPRGRNAVEAAELYADGLATEWELTAARGQGYGPTRDVTFPDAAGTARAVTLMAGKGLAPPAAQAALLRDIFGNPFRPVTWAPYVESSTVLALARAAYDERQPDGMLDPARLAILADALEDAGCAEEPLLRHLRGFETCRHCMLPTPEEAEYGGGIYWCPGCGGTEGGNPDAYWQRLSGPHARGCWALDLILGQE